MIQPTIPAYGRSTLAELLPSIGARLGMPGADTLNLPPAQRYVVLLIDGLGSEALDRHSELAPFLSGAARRQDFTCGVPSTTATSITSLGTGLVPGAHGVAGYTFWHGPSAAVLNVLRWPSELSGLDVQPQLTYLERLARAGVHTAVIAPAHFDASGLTTMALRGAQFWPVGDELDLTRRTSVVQAAAQAGERNLSYCYERSLDHTGHNYGIDSDPWRATLAWVDGLAAALRVALPDDVRLVVTGDHGMVDVPQNARLIVEDEPHLLVRVAALAGEGRFRHLRVLPGAANEVAQRWQDRLGGRAWVRTREQAEAQGWFGAITPRLADRFGDVVIAMADDGAILTRNAPGEFTLIGMHGSLTTAEMQIPLVVA